MSKIRKQFYALNEQGDGELSEYIYNYIFSTYNNYTLQRGELSIDLDYIKYLQDAVINYKYMALDKLDVDLALGALFMDAYLLARLFRKYNYRHIDSDTVIIYAGVNHIDLYRHFLEDIMGFEFKMYTNSESKRCVYIDDFN